MECHQEYINPMADRYQYQEFSIYIHFVWTRAVYFFDFISELHRWYTANPDSLRNKEDVSLAFLLVKIPSKNWPQANSGRIQFVNLENELIFD